MCGVCLYGQVSATFAASLVTSPAIGAYLESFYSDSLVIALATAVAVLDVLFILCFVPESLSDKLRQAQWSSNFSWEKADPFGVSDDNPRTEGFTCGLLHSLRREDRRLSGDAVHVFVFRRCESWVTTS